MHRRNKTREWEGTDDKNENENVNKCGRRDKNANERQLEEKI